MTKLKQPLAIFDSMEFLIDQKDFSYLDADYNLSDVHQAHAFLKSYKGSAGTFNSYRREIERLIQWCALIANKSLKDLKREDIELFIEFSQKPPKNWIGLHKPPRFIELDGVRVPNPDWKPFIVTVSKLKHRQGDRPELKNFELKQGALKQIFAIIGSFYNYLLQEEYVEINPVAMIRQKSKFIRKVQEKPKIRRLSDLQWKYVMDCAKRQADCGDDYHERTLFMMSALYSMYLRISELAASKRWSPKMNDFSSDSDGNWWFTTVGKGNKQRQIAVSDDMLEALKRWRKHLGLTQLPSPADDSPLIPKALGRGPISSTTYIRKIVQGCFDQAISQLKHDNLLEESDSLVEATVHWLRHTGISEDVKTRPKEHVRDDAGHSSSAITDKYIDIKLKERHKSAKKKSISGE
ncbi:MAG: tyrosine-type recombinase/integrase [Rickettsiales bacterium]|jgi:site-specific recombinase XerD|nr:tyrosine-type recombinase/integrase [Rickettsiales bacterium]